VECSVIRNLFLSASASLLAFGLGACSSQNLADPPATAQNSIASGGVSATRQIDQTDSARLEALWQSRTHDTSEGDFSLGPGDVLQVSVPAIDDLKDRSVRVSGDDTITLPLIGVINVKGMTEEEVRTELKKRLDKYMYEPQVDVFAKQYESRQVAVVGMVQKPGLYTLTSASDTVLAMISRAGGATETAAQRILLIPALPGEAGRTSELLGAAAAAGFNTSPTRAGTLDDLPGATASAPSSQPQQASDSIVARRSEGSMPASFAPSHPMPATVGRAEPIVIDLTSTASHTHLDIPARPGDVIIVPAAGEVMVKGWVQNAGAFKITPGMTVLGAIAAAGGEMFSSTGEVLRTSGNGDKVEMAFDVSAIQKGTAADIPVQAGDIVIVNRSVIGAVPYAVYFLMNHFGTGIYPALPML